MKNDAASDRRDFFRIATWGTAVGFGLMLASVASLDRTAAGFSFQFTLATILFFLLGAGLGWGFWHGAITWINSSDDGGDTSMKQSRKNRRQFLVWTAVVIAAGLVCFLFPLKFSLQGQRREILEGFGFAVAVLAFVGFMIWRVIRMFERN